MLYDRLKEANIEALRNHDTEKRSVLSVILNKVKLREIEMRTESVSLTEADVVAVLRKALKELEEERQAFESAGRDENVKVLKMQIEFVESFLPCMMSEEEIREVILTLDDKSVPFVMKYFKANYSSVCDMRLVQNVLKSI